MDRTTSSQFSHAARRRRMTLGLYLAAACMLLLIPASAHAVSTTTVHIFNFDFSVNPQDEPVEDPIIQLGDTIQWVWDAVPHTTESADGQLESWDSGEPEDGIGDTVGDTFSHTFTNVGVFNYYCDIHGVDLGNGQVGGMSGSVTVTPIPAPPALLIGLIGLLSTGTYRRFRRR